jgi:hypothetical protein
MPSESHITAVYNESECNPEGTHPLESKDHDEEKEENVNESDNQFKDHPKPSIRFPNVDVSKFPPRPIHYWKT